MAIRLVCEALILCQVIGLVVYLVVFPRIAHGWLCSLVFLWVGGTTTLWTVPNVKAGLEVWVTPYGDDANPHLIWLTSNEQVLVCERTGINLVSEPVVVAGSGKRGWQDGNATTAEFTGPRILDVSSDTRYVTVADTYGARIRLIDTVERTVRTIAGTGEEGETSGPALESCVGRCHMAVRDPFHSGAGLPDLFITDSGSGCYSLRRLNRRTTLSSLPYSNRTVNFNALCVTPSGTLLASCTSENQLYTIDAKNHEVYELMDDAKLLAGPEESRPLCYGLAYVAGPAGTGTVIATDAALESPSRILAITFSANHPFVRPRKGYVAPHARAKTAASVSPAQLALVPPSTKKPLTPPVVDVPPTVSPVKPVVAGAFVPAIPSKSVEVKREIGSGSFKRVYSAQWSGLPVAKLTLIAGASEVKAVAAFEAELMHLATLRHPNIVQLLGRIKDELSFVCELCDGGTLHSALHGTTATAAAAVSGSASSDAKQSPAAATRTAALMEVLRWLWARDATRAVAYLHSLKPPIIHRDLKSRNFLLTADERLKLTDFGFARVQQNSAGLSAQKAAAGTFAYQSPEQFDDPDDDATAAGSDKVKVSTKSDVYALGGVLLELFGGAEPWSGCSGKKIFQSVTFKGMKPPELERLNVATVYSLIEGLSNRRTRCF